MKPLQVMLTPEQHKQLKLLSVNQGTQMATLVRQWIGERLGK